MPRLIEQGTFDLTLRGYKFETSVSGTSVVLSSYEGEVNVDLSAWRLDSTPHSRLASLRVTGQETGDLRVEAEFWPRGSNKKSTPGSIYWAAENRTMTQGVPNPGERLDVDLEFEPSTGSGGDRAKSDPMRHPARLSGSIVRARETPMDVPAEVRSQLRQVTGNGVTENIDGATSEFRGSLPDLQAIQSAMPHPWQCFLSRWNRDFKRGRITAVPGLDDMCALRFYPTAPINHQLTEEDLIVRLGALRQRWPFRLIGVDESKLLLHIPQGLPAPEALATQLFHLCPDLVDDFPDSAALAAHFQALEAPTLLSLWWD